jgi:uncharacterized protein (TIGR00255 family)
MIHSMTAFASATLSQGWGSLTWELRSLNHRYLETSLRLPEELRGLEGGLRERISTRLGRGKIEAVLHLRQQAAGELVVDTVLAARIAQVCMELDGLLEEPMAISGMDLLRWPGVASPAEPDLGAIVDAVQPLLEEALDELIDNRRREGERLAALLLERVEAIEPLVDEARRLMPVVVGRLRQRLLDRVKELQLTIDPVRLEQEVVIAAQRVDIDEELDRLTTHLIEVRRIIDQGGTIGRRLDFLMQELNREANTLGSKSADSATTRISVELKVLIEQMREQIQNIE